MVRLQVRNQLTKRIGRWRTHPTARYLQSCGIVPPCSRTASTKEYQLSLDRAAADKAAPADVSFIDALRFWLRLGFISFGGPAGQIAVMHRELVERKRWISQRRFLHALNYCMVLPGPEEQQLATYIGWLLHRTGGGLIAGSLFVLPSLLLLIALSSLYVAYGQLPQVMAMFSGVKPAVVAIVCFAVYRIGSRVIRSVGLGVISATAFLLNATLEVPFPWIVAGAAIVAYFGERLAPRLFRGGAGYGDAKQTYGPALIDDDTPPPAHAAANWRRALTIFSIAMIFWGGALWAIGWSNTLSQMSWFFTKAALVTFGSAYAVLPYIFQGAVEQFGWLTTSQMIDGLALGETTPGPLIMVVAVVGYLGAHADAAQIGLSPIAAGMLGAICVTFFTFLPSFVFIFIGAPLIEATRGNLHLTSALNGITAAAVGMLLNLAAFFAYHVLWPTGYVGAIAWPSALIGAAAALLLLRFNAGIIPIVLGSAALGLLIEFVK
jgi:chromate transporter